MRLRKGDRVEVLSQKEVSSGSWSCAEIISGNGRSYSVRFLSSVEAVERVPRRAIRPCPPPVAGSNVWAAGDLAEAFHNSSWKQAKIMKIVSVHCYIVRLLGSPLDVLVGQSNLRMRQAWHDGRWFLLGKAIGGSGSLSRNKQTKTNMVKSKDQQLVVTFPGRRKRPLPSQSISHNLSVQTKKVTEKDVRCLPSSWIKDDMNLTQELNTIRLSSTFRTENVEVTTGSAGLREGNLIPVTSTHSQADSCASSVGSNRSTDEFFKDPFVSVARCSKDVEDVDCHSDAESATGRGHGEEDSCSYKEVLARFHRSELSAFHSFIRALYASGPLSWEDEAHVSNICDSLHISNDEYLMELRNLMSANKRTSV
ncbi:uncharacterized protein LOC111488477 isoform X1 [Cucurbita maxima]|uniref:Uncharacterized protein LOC111488477 isoform X1 n=1 Tax=Cucurbita maxima TaxID=3661 RepID=A0A6J1JXT9_CUCMA|nr:uncharacterized protein LOC111488477 isoform X1 [Cucurbita maxima]XP_022991993.1 uncharacterized protein LOC111488477 isoform X1 [Cucurbita maxima]